MFVGKLGTFVALGVRGSGMIDNCSFNLGEFYVKMGKTNLEFVERFPELSLFFKAYSLLDSEMICIFPYFCPYAESAREIREIFS